MDVQLAAARGAVALGHVLADDVGRLRSGHENRAEVADERLHDVALLEVERIRRGDRFAFLSKRSIQPADHFGLTKERNETLFQRARQSQVIIDFEKLVARESVCFRQHRGH